jgi:hypothetical protein
LTGFGAPSSKRGTGRLIIEELTYLLRQIGCERDLPEEEITRLHDIFGTQNR